MSCDFNLNLNKKLPTYDTRHLHTPTSCVFKNLVNNDTKKSNKGCFH